MENYLNGEIHKASKMPEDTAVLFPAKLFRAANARSGLIEWSDDGSALQVNSLTFEHLVMSLHPNLVEIPNFANFRRQMRAYGFGWSLLFGDIFEFRHNYFKRGRPDLLKCVLTRRKQIKFDAAKRYVHNQRSLRFDPDYPKVRSSFGIVKRQYHRKQKIKPFNSGRLLLSEEIDEYNQKDGVLEDFLSSKNLKNCAALPMRLTDSIDFELHHSCLSWFLQQDPMCARHYEQDMLMDCLSHMTDLVKIPIYFY